MSGYTLHQITDIIKNRHESIYEPGSDGLTPLMMAAKLCEPDCLSEIIRIGYNKSSVKILDHKNNEYDRYFWKQAMFYEKFYKIEILRDIDFRDKRGLTAFQHCIQVRRAPVEKKVMCLRLLAQAGVDLTLKNDRNQTPIEMALDCGLNDTCTVIFACLSDLGCETNLNGCFSYALLEGNIPLMNFFKERGANIHFINHFNENCILHFLYIGGYMKKGFEEVLHVLIQNYKVDINFSNQYSSIFSAAFYLLTKCISFPLQFLMSENIDVMSNAKIGKAMPILDKRQRGQVRMPVQQYAQLLYNYNMPYDMLKRFIGSELDDDIKIWLNESFDSPSSLSKICKFSIRKCLGNDIKWKVKQLLVPEVIKDIILLKTLLPSECFN